MLPLPQSAPARPRLAPCPRGCGRVTLRPDRPCCLNCGHHHHDPEAYPSPHSWYCESQRVAQDALPLEVPMPTPFAVAQRALNQAQHLDTALTRSVYAQQRAQTRARWTLGLLALSLLTNGVLLWHLWL